ncbi:MAG: hypothetical protein FWC41_11285 [Firmicutes bacterium]|nr:hypothetical protein [Bacillota bacterium]
MLVAVVLLSACKKVDDRDEYIGTFKAIEKELGWEDYHYNISISKSSANDNDVIITGLFGEPSLSCYATVNGTSITIPLQTFNNVFTFTGSGRRNGNMLNLSAQITASGGGISNVTIDCTKL